MNYIYVCTVLQEEWREGRGTEGQNDGEEQEEKLWKKKCKEKRRNDLRIMNEFGRKEGSSDRMQAKVNEKKKHTHSNDKRNTKGKLSNKQVYTIKLS